jgi:N-acetyl-anhydromuramyl-L-alanine amidase AmpD
VGSRQGSTQFIADWDTGEIIQTMPETEIAYHVGATSYTALENRISGSENPNDYLIGVECCIGEKSIDGWETSKTIGKPSEIQYAAIVELAADICKRHNLDPLNQLYRHYDIFAEILR